MDAPLFESTVTLDTAQPDVARGRVDAAAEWRHWLTGLTMGVLVFETLTGLAIFLLSFSIWNQFSVLWHTAVGVVTLPPIAWYLGRHWWRRFRGKFNHYQLLGYVTAVLLLAIIVSGFVLTWQAIFETRIAYVWDQIHLITGLAFVAVLVAHTVMLWIRKVYNPAAATALKGAKRSFLVQCFGGAVALLVLHTGSAALYRAPAMNNEFPDDYSWKYGEDRPFAPSLVQTASNWAYDSASMSGSAGCGTSGCHSDILAEWEPSAHRYASADVAFQAVQRLMLEDTGAESKR